MTNEIVQAPTVPESKLQLLRDTYAKGATPSEFELFVAVSNKLRLDPFARQIYAVKRYDSTLKREVMQAQVSIDGMRLTAERTGKYGGQGAPQWCGYDGQWLDVWLSDDEPPVAARVAVYRTDFVQPIVAVALFREYAQRKQGGELTRFWQMMPANQIAKCAESLALRKAFPNELSGVYSDAEMSQAENDNARPTHKPQPPAAKTVAPDKAKPARFHAAWSNPTWAGKALADAPQHVLAEYLEALDRVLADDRRKRLHPDLAKAKAEAEVVYDAIVAAAVDAAMRAESDAALDVADPIAASIQTEHDRLNMPAGDDKNSSWGLEP
jgi:phage recombination protein Bet